MMMNFLMMILFILFSISYFTIMERKILGSFHIRLGPSKTGLMGLFQPFYDAIKLFMKNMIMMYKINILYWNISPIITFIIFLMIMNFMPLKSENNFMHLNMMIMILIISLPIFSMFYSSFFSSNKFSIISSKRFISQMLSYEIGLMMMLIMMIPLKMNFNMMILIISFKYMNYLLKLMLAIILYLIILSETSRIPFDFVEGESELISGFNIEYSSSYFSMFFIYEYGMMLYFSMLMTMLMLKFFMFYVLIFLFIWIRASFPRFRYDKMMKMFWKNIYFILICIYIIIKMFS